MNDILNDEKMYKKLNKDPAPALERWMNALLLDLNKKGAIPQLYERLRSRNPLLYGLLKIHKPNIPLHPIDAVTNVPAFETHLRSPFSLGRSILLSCTQFQGVHEIYHLSDAFRR